MRGLTVAKPSKYYNIALHNALIKRDKEIEPNLTQGPLERKVSWAMLKRTIPCFDEAYATLRGFPDGK